MPSVAENVAVWDGHYDWSQGGEEWSAWWGSSDAEWRWTLLPRLAPYLPSRRASARFLEIAPGFGRWTRFLLPHAETYCGVDLSQECVDACRKRFAGAPHARFVRGSGKTLDEVEQSSIDLAFSFDALVHVEADVIDGYMRELQRVLAPDGVAFIHHSIAGLHKGHFSWWREGKLLRARHALATLTRGLVDRLDHWRGESVTPAGVRQVVADAGLTVLSQELFPWGTRRLTDAITVVAHPGSRWTRNGSRTAIRETRDFMREARRARAMTSLPDHAGS
jgi:SAM-dependent methyltransferase